jgi:regulator of sigma D
MENDVNSKSESQARKALIRLCQEIVDYYSEEDFKEEVED